MESWRRVFREAVAPRLSRAGLESLAQALRSDDKRLIQGSTTTPPPLICTEMCEPLGACLIGFPGWQGDGLKTVGEVEEFFAKVCYEIDQHFQEPTACRWLLNTYDDWPREEMRRLLLPEVELALAGKDKDESKEVA